MFHRIWGPAVGIFIIALALALPNRSRGIPSEDAGPQLASPTSLSFRLEETRLNRRGRVKIKPADPNSPADNIRQNTLGN